ncbi:MAG: BrnA antitoxin family protein [Rhodoferax sp.]|nr:BrnA antitoxin family protein [Rhodoferax sp.]
MNAKLPNTAQPWVDPDDAPELTDADFARGTWTIGDKVVTKEEAQLAIGKKLRGRPVGSVQAKTKEPVKIRLDADVLAALRGSGDGWQTRINDALRASLVLAGKL